MQKQLKLWCFAQRTPEGWWAICTSLNVAVDAPTLSEVRELLDGAIRAYLDYVAALPVEEQSRFLARKASWSVRAKLWTLLFLSRLFPGGRGRHDGGGMQTIRFPECPDFG